MLYRLDISTIYFYEPLLFQIFVLWKFIKTWAFHFLLSLLQSIATQTTISMNIFICFKYYTVWNLYFLLKCTLRFFFSNLIRMPFFIKMYIKGNMQLILLCNPQKSGASRVCITFPQTTQKILTRDLFHWLELIIEIQSFLQIFIARKTTTQFF